MDAELLLCFVTSDDLETTTKYKSPRLLVRVFIFGA